MTKAMGPVLNIEIMVSLCIKNGDEGIRTLVPEQTDKLISSQPRYGHFGTSPHHRNL